MEQREYVAALDLGTSKMLAVAASKSPDGTLKLLASEKMGSGIGIRRGFIYNVQDVTEKVSSIIDKLDKQLNPGLKKIYVGIGGQSLRTETYVVKKEINGATVTNEIIDSLYEECRKHRPELAEILDIVSPEYYLDGRLETKPIGVTCNVIETKFQLILGRPSLKICLKKSIEEKVNLEIAGYFVSPLATAEAVLTAREKELGCALIEFGAGVTYLSIYKNGLLKYMVAIPLGGNVITKDLCSANLLEQDAEELKITQGSALSETDKEELTDVIIEARMNEIIANIVDQIQVSGYKSALIEGIIITGGASQLKNLSKSLQFHTNQKVRRAVVSRSLVDTSESTDRLSDDPANSTIFGLLTLSTDNCAKEMPKVDTATLKSKEPVIQDIFGEEFSDVSQIEPEKKKQLRKAPKENIFDKFKRRAENLSRNLFDSEENNTDE